MKDINVLRLPSHHDSGAAQLAGMERSRAAPASGVQQEPHPAILGGEEPSAYLCVYPFVCPYDWYLLPEADRRKMLADHGKETRTYPDVRANTMAAFALGDNE
jgi:chlorite dismutase